MMIGRIIVRVHQSGGICGDRMTGNKAKIWTGIEESLVEVRRKSAKTLDFQRIGVPWGLFCRSMGHTC